MICQLHILLSRTAQPPIELHFCAELHTNQKSELMLMRRATASVSFRTQVVLVNLQHISAKIVCVAA